MNASQRYVSKLIRCFMSTFIVLSDTQRDHENVHLFCDGPYDTEVVIMKAFQRFVSKLKIRHVTFYRSI